MDTGAATPVSIEQDTTNEDDAKVTKVAARRLLRHATGVFFFSTWIVGLLHADSAVKLRKSESQFRTAHVGGTVHAALMFGMAAALRELRLSHADRHSLVTWTIVMGWGNSLGYAVGAVLGARGLEPKPDRNLAPLSLFVSAMYALARVLQLTWRGSAP